MADDGTGLESLVDHTAHLRRSVSFGDSACTQRVVGLDRAFAIFAMADPGIARAFEVHRIAGPHTSIGYVLSDAGCTEYPKGSGYPVGETVPLASFARLTAKP